MNVRSIGLDLDGTLLEPDASVSLEAKEALRDAYATGVVLGIVTGRPYQRTLHLLDGAGLLGSAGVFRFLIVEEREVYWKQGIGFMPDVFWNTKARRCEVTLLNQLQEWVQGVGERLERDGLGSPLRNLDLERERGFVELGYESSERADQAATLLEELLTKDGPTGVVVRRNRTWVALRSGAYSKGVCLEHVAASMGIANEEVLAVGDSGNDVTMLDETYGFQVATTENAEDPIKSLVRRRKGVVAGASYSQGVAEILGGMGGA